MAVAALLLLPPAALAQSGESAVARGDGLMAAFRTDAAIAVYRDGLVVAPDDVELLSRLARALGNLAQERAGAEGDEARYTEAVELARRAVGLEPSSSRAHSTLAAALGRHALFQGGKRKVELAREVRHEADRAVELDPGDYSAFIVLGAWNREVATLNPLLRGIAGTFLGGLPRASLRASAAALERARRLAPSIIFTRVELARTYLEMDRDDAALRELDAALSLPPREQLDRVLQEQARELRSEVTD